MPLKIIRQDITKIECDAIVNPTNTYLYAGGGLDLKIRMAANSGLEKFCDSHKIKSVGDAIISPPFGLPCRYIIHVAGPVYDGRSVCDELLKKSYLSCLSIAQNNGCENIAIPLISSGTNGFPKDKVLKIATDSIVEFLSKTDMLVYLVVYDKDSYDISSKLFYDITSYIDENYIEDKPLFKRPRIREEREFEFLECNASAVDEAALDFMLENMDKSFAETLFELIDKRGISDVEAYKRSNVDKKVFSKIKCNKHYKPSKITAVSFAIGLKLNSEETERLLKTAGLALSKSNRFDVIIGYFIETGNYDTIFDVNEVLYKLDEFTLGV